MIQVLHFPLTFFSISYQTTTYSHSLPFDESVATTTQKMITQIDACGPQNSAMSLSNDRNYALSKVLIIDLHNC